MRQIILAGVLVFSTASFAAPPIGPVQEAQLCLDRLPENPEPRDTDACLIPIENVNTPEAEGLRCAIAFVREGFTAERLHDVFTANSRSNSATDLRESLSLLSFTSGGQSRLDLARAETTFESCSKSQGKGSSLISAFSVIQMSLVKYLIEKGACVSESPTIGPKGYAWYNLGECLSSAAETDLAQLTNVATTDEDAIDAQMTAGSVAVEAYAMSCQNGGNPEFCRVLKRAVTAGGITRAPRIVAVDLFLGTLK